MKNTSGVKYLQPISVLLVVAILSRELRAHNYANALGKIHFIIAPSFVSFLLLF